MDKHVFRGLGLAALFLLFFLSDHAERWTPGFSELAKYAEEFPPKAVEEITWVPWARIADAVRLLAANRLTEGV